MAHPVVETWDVSIRVEEMTVADHLRQQIRETCTSSLRTALVPAVLVGVETGRPYVHAKTELPRANIWTRQEQVLNADDIMDGGAAGGAEFRQVELMVELRDSIQSEATPDLQARLDGYALEVEKAMVADPALRALLYDLQLSGTAFTVDREAHEKPVGLLELVWAATYRVDPTDPSVQR